MTSGADGFQSDLAAQREVTRLALTAIRGFALAGSGAIREHGVTDRPTEDVDLFTDDQDLEAFEEAVHNVVTRLRAAGFTVEQVRRAPLYARLQVATGAGGRLDVDLGVDWRQDEPVRLDVGPVLSLADAIGNKVGALYSRGEARDYLDIDAIRMSGPFSDEELIAAAGERDPGFDIAIFADQLSAVVRLRPAQVARYGITASDLDDVKARCLDWAGRLRATRADDRSD